METDAPINNHLYLLQISQAGSMRSWFVVNKNVYPTCVRKLAEKTFDSVEEFTKYINN